MPSWKAATGDDSFPCPRVLTQGDVLGPRRRERRVQCGTKKQLNAFVEGDIVSMNAVSLGPYSYDTQLGGNTTVPAFLAVTIKAEKGDCS
jgi:hypothetical protein